MYSYIQIGQILFLRIRGYKFETWDKSPIIFSIILVHFLWIRLKQKKFEWKSSISINSFDWNVHGEWKIIWFENFTIYYNLLLIIFVEFSRKLIHRMELIIKNFNEHLKMNFFFTSFHFHFPNKNLSVYFNISKRNKLQRF